MISEYALTRSLKTTLVLTALTLLSVACGGGADKQESDTDASSAAAADLSPLTGADASWATAEVAGINWKIPAGWEVGPEAPMRAGTYFAPASGGDSEPAECRVNYFGPDQGGGVQQNILRWAGQMEVEGQQGQSPEPQVSSSTVNGQNITVMEASGVFLSRKSMMDSNVERKSGFRMFAAIVEGPQGSVFFKMTGPEATIDAAREDFRKMIGSVSDTGA